MSVFMSNSHSFPIYFGVFVISTNKKLSGILIDFREVFKLKIISKWEK